MIKEREQEMDVTKKMLPIGIEDFREMRTENFYYVDKTGMIRDLLTKWGKVNLFTRPRRFGKSLNMSMLKEFFEIGSDKSIFEGLEICQEKALCEKYMGQFPVISITLKNIEGMNYPSAYNLLIDQIGGEARRFELLEESEKLSKTDRNIYAQLIKVSNGTEGRAMYDMSESTLVNSLNILTELLFKHYGKKVVLLIDEYDVPLDKAFQRGYYTEMVSLIRSLFGSVLKTNPNLQFAVLTGCLRIAKESIFTGLNNLRIFSGTAVRFDEYFGFTDDEVREMLSYYGFEEKYAIVKEWYDGYRFGTEEVYCPWDVINYCDNLTDDSDAEPQNYWINTSGNDAVRYLLQKAGDGVLKSEIESLIAGELVEKEIREDLTYNEIYSTVNNVWSLLFMTGYLTQRGIQENSRVKLTIPNLEIRSIFIDQILCMFRENIADDGSMLKAFCNALEKGNASEVERLFLKIQ